MRDDNLLFSVSSASMIGSGIFFLRAVQLRAAEVKSHHLSFYTLLTYSWLQLIFVFTLVKSGLFLAKPEQLMFSHSSYSALVSRRLSICQSVKMKLPVFISSVAFGIFLPLLCWAV